MNRIKVNDEIIETTSLVAQTYRVNNLGDISTRQGSSSNNLSIPLTAKNREALGFPEDFNETLRTPYTRIDAQLFDGEVFVSTGYLKINSVDTRSINCTFFSDNTGWFNQIKDKTLKDLTGLSVYDHLYSEGSIIDSLDGSEGYIYPIIDYGEFKNADLGSGIAVEQLFPAMFVSIIFEEIFSEAGYTIEGELLDLWEYNNSIIPFSADDFVHGQAYILENTIRITFSALFPTSITFTTGGPTDIQFLTNIIIPSIITPNEPGKYLVTIYVDISNINIAFGETANIILYRDRFGTPTVVEPFFTFTNTSSNGQYSLTKEVDLD
ncbi:MAG: hypothetical protein HRU26_11505, partial [Psychroserpens sp.]|nr:hypothetical protein [Psychroserpens sp.]